jgi:hypothetical protein
MGKVNRRVGKEQISRVFENELLFEEIRKALKQQF